MVVEFGITVFVKGEPIAFGAERLSLGVVGEGGVALGRGLFKLRKQRSPVGEARLIQAGKVAQGGKEIDGFDNRVRLLARIFHAGNGDDEGGAEGFFEEAVLAPDGVFSEVPAVIAPEHDDSVFVAAGFLEFGEDFADVMVNVTDAGGVVTTHFVCVGAIFARVLPVVEILGHEFA